ncbi:magnesium transporter [bacterium]|nr:magnesium transporter [bacterium]
MLSIFRNEAGKLVPSPVEGALWLDLCKPTPEEMASAAGLVPEVPSLADLEEIEISSRLYREDGFDYMTVLVPGLSREDGVTPITGPVAFILGKGRLMTVRYHSTRPFETYAPRAEKVGLGCGGPDRVFLGLCDEIIGRIADLMEGAGRELDKITKAIFSTEGLGPEASVLQMALETSGRQSDLVGNCRLSLLTLERALGFFRIGLEDKGAVEPLKATIIGLTKDIQSLEVHGDYLSSRVAQATDATLGMINLAQNTTVRIVSVVAVLFLPPTLIASVYGMNFRVMPELGFTYGYPMAIGLMVGSAVLTWRVFKWKKWL